VLAGIVSQETVPPAGRVSSAGFLLDRLGRAPQPHAGEDGNDIESPSGKLSRAMRVDLDLPSGGDCSYPGLLWHEGRLWMTYYSSHEKQTCIYLAQIEITFGATAQ